MISFLRVCLLLLGIAVSSAAEPGVSLVQQAYVWQRHRNQPVLDAVRVRSAEFDRLVVLAGEIQWEKSGPSLVQIAYESSVLRQTGRSVGLALRIGPFSGPFAEDAPPARFLVQTARSILAEAASNQLSVAELQLDFDCAASKLAGYRQWVDTLKTAIAPTRLTITTLPSWLGHPDFAPLARAADGFVLQVHSLEPPAGLDATFTLCDPAAARAAVEQAAKVGVLFRVALPTYGYGLTFDRQGRFSRLFAEGMPPSVPSGHSVREVRADPVALSRLVRDWSTHRPSQFEGILWYRLPVEGDVLNWRWPTLATVLRGEVPVARLEPFARTPSDGPIELELMNSGTADHEGPVSLSVAWPEEARLLAADALPPFRLERTAGRIVFTSATATRVPAGERRRVGWLRFSQPTEVSLALQPAP